MIDLPHQLRNVVAGICALYAMGCHTTRNVKLVENPDATSRPSQVEVVTRGGSTIVVYDPVVRRDSLTGFSDKEKTIPTALAVSDIQTAKSRQFSGGRTAAFVLALVAAAAVTAFVLFAMAISEVGY